MDIHRAVTEFVSHSGRNLFHLLRSEGIMLSESELLALDVQLQVLENEVAITRMLKKNFSPHPLLTDRVSILLIADRGIELPTGTIY